MKAGLQIIRLLYRNELADFKSWCIELLAGKINPYTENEI